MVIQNETCVTINFIANILECARLLGYGQFLLGIFFVDFFCHHPLDTVKTFPDLNEGCVEWREAETDIIRFAEVGDDVHVFDQGAVDPIAVRVADGDV